MFVNRVRVMACPFVVVDTEFPILCRSLPLDLREDFVVEPVCKIQSIQHLLLLLLFYLLLTLLFVGT